MSSGGYRSVTIFKKRGTTFLSLDFVAEGPFYLMTFKRRVETHSMP
jgi:hypothetical protein